MMVKPGATDWSGGGKAAADSPELHHADHVLGELTRGRTVPETERSRAENALVDLLWRGGSGDAQRASQGLMALSERASPVERMRRLGHAAAAGRRALALFDELAASGDLPLSSEEKARLREVTEKGSVEARLRVVAELLDPAAKGGKSPERELPFYPGERAVLTRRSGDPEPQARTPSDRGGDRPDEDLEDLLDQDLAPGLQIQLVHSLGQRAVPELLARLGSPQHGEMATMLLLSLARDPGLRRNVYDAVLRLEADEPDLRDRADLIARKIEHDARGLPGDDAGARERVRGAGLGTSFLERALDLCDTPSLLLASAGREVVVLPMAMARLATRRGATDSGER